MAQDPNDLRGKVLRLDPLAGDLTPEIVASGLRNPFKASFDAENGRYFIADVGEDTYEEIIIFSEDANFGWSIYEGTAPGGGQPLGGGVPVPAAYDFPLLQYGADDPSGLRHSITGGLSYYGEIAALDGQYVFGDYVQNRIWSFGSNLSGVSEDDVTLWDLAFDQQALDGILTFGRDGAGGLFVSDIAGRVYQVTSATAPVPLPAGAGLLLSALAATAGHAARGRAKNRP